MKDLPVLLIAIFMLSLCLKFLVEGSQQVTPKYEFRCKICGIRATIPRWELTAFGPPQCSGWEDPDLTADDGTKREPHKRTEMKRVWAANVVWPAEKRGH